MTNQKLPSDALTTPARPIRTALIAVAAVVVVAGLSFGGVAVGQTLTAHVTATAVALPADTPAPLTAEELATLQAGADAQQAQIVADAAAKAAADAAAAQAAADAAAAQAAAQASAAAAKNAAAAPQTTGLPAGAIMPNVPGTNQPDTTACASSTGTTNASGVAVCA